jgi:hypothetical protein
MIYSRSRNRVRLVCALLATTVIPVLAFAGIDNGKGNNGQNNGKQNGHARQVGPDLRAGRFPAGTLEIYPYSYRGAYTARIDFHTGSAQHLQ